MPVTYRIDGDLVELTWKDVCPPDEVFETFHQALEDPELPDEFVLLADVRGSTSLASRPTAEIIRVAEYLGPFRDRVKRCAVLASEDIHFGLGRLGAVYSETAGVMTSVFRDRDEALAWLRSVTE
ncbi:MAG TPA: hypothetical protein VFH88_11345 [Candidatus Krumholzibacteria bacterium]|nr:hypothetical protein [Candidatus Krumholzibacteria bacterium]